MPIKPENAARYPADWNRIRYRILRRAGDHCEQCGVANYALGGRDRAGNWLRALPMGETVHGLRWPRQGDMAWCTGGDSLEQLRIIRIVLTIAHLDHTPENCSDDNLRAWCQRCHLAYDAKHHQETAYQTRRQGKAVGDLFL